MEETDLATLVDVGHEAPQVVIAGGGPTGLWLACELALARVGVAVLETLPTPTGLSKALGLQSRTMEMLDHRGILDRFTAGNPAPPFLNFAMFPLDLHTIDFSHPYGVVIPQSRVEALLEERARELGAEIRRGHEIVGLRQNAEGVTAEVRTESGGYELTSQYLIGCDGAHSVVRKQIGAAFSGMDPTVVGRMGDVKLAPGALELLKQHVPELGGRDFGIARTDTGNFAIVPMGPDLYRVAVIEWDQGAIDRNEAIRAHHVRSATEGVVHHSE